MVVGYRAVLLKNFKKVECFHKCLTEYLPDMMADRRVTRTVRLVVLTFVFMAVTLLLVDVDITHFVKSC